MEFRDNLYQFGQSGILTFRDGIQEVSGSIPLISTESLETHWFQGFFVDNTCLLRKNYLTYTLLQPQYVYFDYCVYLILDTRSYVFCRNLRFLMDRQMQEYVR